MKYSFCIVLHVAADGATTPGISGSQKEAGVRFRADCNLGKSLVNKLLNALLFIPPVKNKC